MLTLIPLCLAATTLGQSSLIRVNQVGYAMKGPKLAVLLAPTDTVRLLGPHNEVAWKGVPSDPLDWAEAEETGQLVDFSSFRTPGTWRLEAGSEASWPIVIQRAPWEPLLKGLIKGLWYNRASYAIPSGYGGQWSRAAGHPDTDVRVHSSAVGPVRTTASRIRSPGGWYDAGDYGKYLPSAAISTWSLLHLYQQFPSYLDTLDLGVPEHPQIQSDLLDEAVWNLRWMLSMQDPTDGGVYHRLTTTGFPSDATMPDADRGARYVSQKSTAAALDLAATAAKAYRVLRDRSPALADSCLHSAQAAWNWARRNPTQYFLPDSINEHFSPSISAGPYSDQNVSDEFDWAASELMLATGQDSFSLAVRLGDRVAQNRRAPMIDWGDVRSLGLLSLSLEKAKIPASAIDLGEAAGDMITMAGRAIRKVRLENGFHLPEAPYKWSSNTVFANNGILCWSAWRITGDTSFQSAAIDMLDYLLGRNATGYSFVTGFGGLTPIHPHHRISSGDAVDAPVPGMLVGGPNPGQEDACAGYPSKLAPKSYVDASCSYASNEPAINQNAALILLAGSLSAELADSGSTSRRTHPRPLTLSVSIHSARLRVQIPSPDDLEVEVFGVDGRSRGPSTGANGTIELAMPHSGVWQIQARSAGKTWGARVTVP
ncbi:MAG: glycoside hydrolase family 9 protein [Fibrobacteres bacterium]|nr:glycoside hydrolase family 9 protein [Fibrobacterota bacterium]